jgi:hypothetical protein
VTRVAVEIAKAMPMLADATDEQVRDLVDGWTVLDLPPLSPAVHLTIEWARLTERLVQRVDADTVDALLEVVDRLRAGMAR